MTFVFFKDRVVCLKKGFLMHLAAKKKADEVKIK